VEFVGGKIQTVAPGPDALSGSAWSNWFSKHRLVAYDWWLAGLEKQHGSDPAFQAMLPAYRGQMEKVRSEDALKWQGWFANHGGETLFLADHLTAWSTVSQVLLVALFLALAGSVYWRTT
jgi:hypothetical protein